MFPPLWAPEAPSVPSLGGVFWMFPSMLRWTFEVLYVALVFCLPSLSLLCFFVLFMLVWDFPIVEDAIGAGGVGEC